MPLMKQFRECSFRSEVFFTACCIALWLMCGCGKSTPPDTRAADEAALRDTDAQWAKTAASKDVDATTAFYADGAVLLPPNARATTDKQAIRGIWADLLAPGTTLSWQANKIEVARSGDLGYVTGVYQASLTDAQGKPVSDQGKFLEVWKKQPDGKWKCVVDTYSSDLPLPAPQPAKPAGHPRHHKKSHTKRHS
jgi:ketosteroid isomerase-like protein